MLSHVSTCSNFIIIAHFLRKKHQIRISISLRNFQVDELDNNPDRENVAKKVIKQLSNITDLDKKDKEERKYGIKPQDLDYTVRILDKIVSSSVSAGTLELLSPANNILDSRNTKSWRNMTVS